MPKIGRNSFVATDLVRHGEPGRLSPPASLGEAEKRAFVDLVMGCPAGQFQACDSPLLSAWAETVALRERMATRMSVEGELDEKGKPSGAFTIHKEATKTLNALSEPASAHAAGAQARAASGQLLRENGPPGGCRR
jgi:hypothetical protein